MAKRISNANRANLGFEVAPWAAADKVRGLMDATESASSLTRPSRSMADTANSLSLGGRGQG